MQIKYVAAALALAFTGSIPALAAAQEVVKIGHVAATSGPSAHLGKEDENGARLAVEDLNAQGFKIDGKVVKFVLLAEDDAADPKQGTAAATKLVDARINGIIGHQNSGTTIPASKIYFDAGIPQISASATSPVYTHQGFNTAFRIVANDNKLGGTLGKYAVHKLGAKRIAVIDDRTAYGQGVATEFIKGSKGATIVDKQYTTDKASDFTAILTTIRAKNPDLVFFGGMDAIAGALLRQMKALGIKARFMGGDGICTEALPKLSGGADDIVTCAEAGGILASQRKGLDAFNARYKAKYNSEVQIYAPYAYDAVMTMASAMAQAKSADPAKYLPFLAKIKYQGITGPISFDKFGDINDGALTLYGYKDGKRQLLEVVK